MGSGFHGMNGISPAISIHIYRTYVLPRVLYGLEGTIRKSKHITKLERFHRKTLRQLQTLPDRTATCAVYLLGGILPMEAYLDAQIATLLYMVDHDMDSSLARTALYQLSNKDSKSSSWFVYSYIQLNRYDLDPLNILQNYISKGDIRRNIRSYWFNIITNEAYEKSSLSYLDVSKCRLDVTHPVWASVGSNPTETRKAVIKARLLAGSYTLQANRAAFNQYQVRDQCPLCQGDPEDRIHFILLCPELSESRDRHLRIIRAVYPEYDILSNHLKVTILLDSNTCVHPECDTANLEVASRNFIYIIHCHRTRILNTAPV